MEICNREVCLRLSGRYDGADPVPELASPTVPELRLDVRAMQDQIFL